MKKKKIKIVGVIGGYSCSRDVYVASRLLGSLLAKKGYMVVCGGLGGVMKGVCEGAYKAGGITIGILPGKFSNEANPYIRIPVVTAMSHARNAIIVRTADVLVAVDGKYGTLSEIGMALSIGKKVISLKTSWNIPGIIKVQTAEEAVGKIEG